MYSTSPTHSVSQTNARVTSPSARSSIGLTPIWRAQRPPDLRPNSSCSGRLAELLRDVEVPPERDGVSTAASAVSFPTRVTIARAQSARKIACTRTAVCEVCVAPFPAPASALSLMSNFFFLFPIPGTARYPDCFGAHHVLLIARDKTRAILSTCSMCVKGCKENLTRQRVNSNRPRRRLKSSSCTPLGHPRRVAQRDKGAKRAAGKRLNARTNGSYGGQSHGRNRRQSTRKTTTNGSGGERRAHQAKWHHEQKYRAGEKRCGTRHKALNLVHEAQRAGRYPRHHEQWPQDEVA